LSPLQLASILLVIGAAWAIREGQAGWGFAATTAAMASTVSSIFVTLYPNVMVSSTNSSYNLTVAKSASSSYALTTMTVVAVIFVPLVLAYQGWSYYVFRARITAPRTETEPLTTTPSSTAPPTPTVDHVADPDQE
jgi:cytochrome d ubiquinol oxidase subunit II